MAGIGDYVHYRLENYKKFGSHKEGQGSFDLSKAMLDQQKHLETIYNNKKNSTDLQRLGRYFSNFYYGDSVPGKISGEDENKLSEETLNVLYEATAKIIQEQSIKNSGTAWTAEDVKRTLRNPSDAIIRNRKFTGKELNQSLSIGSLKDALEGLQAAQKKTTALFNSRAVNGKISLRDVELSKQELDGQINSLIRKLEDILRKLSNLPDSKQIKFNSINYKQPNTGNLKNADIPDFKGLLLYIQDVLKLYQAKSIYLIAGDSSEVMAVLRQNMQYLVQNEAEINVENLLNRFEQTKGSLWQGQQAKVQNYTAPFGSFLYKDMMISKLNESSNNLGTWSAESDEYSLTYTPSGKNGPEGTVDIVLSPSEDPALESILNTGNNINASLKNYSTINSHGVSLIQRTPLLSLLITGNFTENFVNHYANLINAQQYNEYTSEYEHAKKYIYWGAGLRGFSGLNKDNELLIINDKGSKTVYLESIYNFNQTLAVNYANINSILKVSQEGSIDYNTINTFVPDKEGKRDDRYSLAGVRITNFFIKLNQVKLTVSLRSSAVKNFTKY